MSKFYGSIGYASSEEISPGAYADKIVVTKQYCGDVIRNTGQHQSGENLNDDIKLSNEFSIIGDPFAYANFYQMRYVEYLGTKWKITNVEVQYPRLIITVGGVYNDPTS